MLVSGRVAATTLQSTASVVIGVLLLAVVARRAPGQATAVAPSPIGVWRGTSLCLVRPSPCNDEVVVYRISRLHSTDSLSIDARKVVDAREEQMGVLACRLANSASSITCSINN